MLHLTLREAINRATRYNLGEIESGENARIARGQRLRALSALFPQVSAGSSVTAYASLYRSLQAQAASLAYIDTFMVLGVASAIMFVLAFFLKKNEPGGGVTVAE